MAMKQHILVFDNENHTRLALNITLRSAGFKVTMVRTVEESSRLMIAAASGGDPINMLVVNISLPDMKGMNLIDTLNEKRILTPTLVITGFREKQFLKELKRRGNYDFLFKPFSDDEFLRKTQAVLDHTQIQEEEFLLNGSEH